MKTNFQKQNAMEAFFFYMELGTYIRVLDSCMELKGMGYGECYGFMFAHEYQPHEEGYFGGEGVRYDTIYPRLEEEFSSLQEFYNRLAEHSKKFKNEKEEMKIIKEKLKKIKVLFKL